MDSAERQAAVTAPEQAAAPESASRREFLRTAAATGLAATIAATSEPAIAEPTLSAFAGRMNSPPSFFKQRASEDYRLSMQPFGGRLAAPTSELFHASQGEAPAQFDVAIIGSGYGGAICAARLAAKFARPDRICVLERGQEWIPGTFPDTVETASQQTRFDLISPRQNKVNNAIGLINSAKFDEVNVLCGSGLGGGSLINANVAIRPDPDVFQTGDWPEALTDPAALAGYYDRASHELGIMTESLDGSPKMLLQRQAMNRMACSVNFAPADLGITRGPKCELPQINRQGIRQRACIDCGDCCSGCNVGAKNSLAMNYLPLARGYGVKMFTHCEADHLEKCSGQYRVHFRHYQATSSHRQPFVRGSITARIVIVSAGSLGSTEILLRSQSRSLHFSSALGTNWSGNGDALGFIREIPELTNIGGHGAYPTRKPPVGPTIQSNVTFPGQPNVRDRFLMQDGAIARAYANVLGLVLRDMDLDHTMVILAMGHDGSAGKVSLDSNGYALVKWPGLLESEYRRRVQAEFSRLAVGLRGTYKTVKAFGENLVTVHPLGGCKLGENPGGGVVNQWGQVFDPEKVAAPGESPIHDGLYIADGSIIPGSLGSNPFLTIAALSERIAERITAEPKYADLRLS